MNYLKGFFRFSATIYCNILESYVYHWKVVTDRLEVDNLYYGAPRSSTTPSPSFKRSLRLTIIPMVWVTLFAIRAGIVVADLVFQLKWINTPTAELISFAVFLPREARFSMEMAFLLWSIMNSVGLFFEVSRSLLQYRFLAILVVSPASTIKPSMLGLDDDDYHHLQLVRKWGALLLRVLNASVIGVSFTIVLLNPLVQEAFVLSWPLATINFALFIYWVGLMTHSCYQQPYMFVLLVFYARIKLRHIKLRTLHLLTSIDRLILRPGKSADHRRQQQQQILKHVQEYHRIYRDYLKIFQEIQYYCSNYWQSYLTLVIFIMLTIFTYLLYLLFMQSFAIGYKIVFTMVMTFHMIVLLSLVHCAVSIYRVHLWMGVHLLRINTRCIPFTSWQTRLKVNNRF